MLAPSGSLSDAAAFSVLEQFFIAMNYKAFYYYLYTTRIGEISRYISKSNFNYYLGDSICKFKRYYTIANIRVTS